jgi:hypothetical protein
VRSSNPFPNYQYRYNIAIEYLTVIQETAEYGLLHGDAHPGNVVVKAPPLKRRKAIRDWPPTIGLKLLGFGTSIFNDKDSSVDRHWRIVDKTIYRILGTHASYEDMKSEKPPHSEPERLIDFYRGPSQIVLSVRQSQASNSRQASTQKANLTLEIVGPELWGVGCITRERE